MHTELYPSSIGQFDDCVFSGIVMTWSEMCSLIIVFLIRSAQFATIPILMLDLHIDFLAAVLEWRRIKQQRLTCITALTVRSPMGHRSVSY